MLPVQICGIIFEHPIMNAAGTCKVLTDVQRLAVSTATAVVVGSITLEARQGNSGTVYFQGDGFSLNSLGLPNPGLPYYRQHLPEMTRIAHYNGKPLIVSVAGFSPDEYGELAEAVLAAGADGVELNLGCPNVWSDGKQKRIVCFDVDMVSKILFEVEKKIGRKKILIKISPFSDPFTLAEVSRAIASSSIVGGVTTTNTFPNAFAFEAGRRPAITPAGGLGGMAGPALKPIGLGQVRQLRAFLPEQIQLVGAGGITTGQDVADYLAAGAIAVQVATAYWQRGEDIFSELLRQFLDFSPLI